MDDAMGELATLPGVFEAVDAARGAVDALLREVRAPELRRRLPQVRAVSLQRSARASTLLQLGVTAAAWLEPFEPPFPDDVAGRTAGGALRVSAALSGLAGTWSVAPLQALARLHTLAASGLAPADELGRPGPAPGVPGRLSGLAGLAMSPGDVPAVVIAAVVHGELLALSPFGSADGVVARAAARLVLMSRGLDPIAVSIPEEGHLELMTEYGLALEGYRSGGRVGVGEWIVHCASALAVGAQSGREVARLIAGQAPQPR